MPKRRTKRRSPGRIPGTRVYRRATTKRPRAPASSKKTKRPVLRTMEHYEKGARAVKKVKGKKRRR